MRGRRRLRPNSTKMSLSCREKLLRSVEVPVPQTDTGRRVEHTKVNGGPFVKELCKMTS